MSFPTTLDTTTTIPAESAGTPLSTNHVTSHTAIQTAIIAIETLVGVTASAVTGTFNYILGEITGSDKAVGKTATQTMTNKTLTSPVLTTPTINVGSDADGDTYYRLSGVFVRLAKSTNGKILRLIAGVPAWDDETATVNASTTVKGVVEAATSAEVTAGTATGATGAVLVVTPDSLAGSTPVFNGSALTNVIATSNGTTTKNAADASATQTIAHGLGKTPKTIELHCTLAYVQVTVGGSGVRVSLYAHAFYNGTTQSSQSFYATNDNVGQGATFTLNTANANDTTVGVVTVDSTNISIAWTKSGSPTGTYNILWRAVA